MIGRIHSLESCGAVDGPGLRFVVFTQGCAMRCLYCHNPDTWPRTEGREVTVDQLMNDIRAFIPFMKTSGGGVTVSGGEPLLQPQFVATLFAECHKLGIHTALDTNGNAEIAQALPVLEHTDLVLLDIKQMNPAKHKELTGLPLDRPLRFARYLAEIGKPVWLRYVVVPGSTDAEEDVEALADLLATMPNVEKVELLPYHLLGRHKWDVMGLPYELEGVEPPTPEVMNRIRAQFTSRGLEVE